MVTTDIIARIELRDLLQYGVGLQFLRDNDIDGRVPVVYSIHNKKLNKYYVGSTVNMCMRLYNYIKSHIYRIRKSCHRFVTLDNIDEFELLILDKTDEEELRNREVEYIELYDSYNSGYNLDVRGQGGNPISPATGRRWATNGTENRLLKPTEELPENWWFGCTHHA